MDSSLIKQMPVSVEAEQALLGSLIVNPDSFGKIGSMIAEEDFYVTEHKHIYSALLKMYAQSKTIDLVTLVNTLVELGDRDEAGGIQYITLIADSVPSASNIKDYAKIVKDKSTLRKLITITDEISTDAYNEGDVRTLVDSAEQRIFDLSHNNEAREFRHIRDVLQNVYKDIELTSERKGAVDGAKTGFSALDRMLVQMGKGDFVIVGARPGMGKTSFALNIATNVAKNSGKAVCIFSLEMSAEQLVTRIISSEALVDSHSLRTGELRPEDWDNIADVISQLSGCDIYIDDTSAITAAEMKSKLRRVNNLGLVVIDYIGLMQTSGNSDNRAQQVGEISRNLKIMAKDFGIPIVCCAQLNRGTESRPGAGKRPTLADLRDSGSIEQDADIVLFLYRDEYYKDISGAQDDSASADSANTAEVIVAKNRHGSVGNVKMGWIGQFTKFRTLENDHEE
ncbi:MAG: replicative DNA helicase [Clostridia bacterium]|nr:replicative DNA helicase [Clostridia bacterium]MBP3582921.1 replicative DNA helicase [Clostridia bacterium]